MDHAIKVWMAQMGFSVVLTGWLHVQEKLDHLLGTLALPRCLRRWFYTSAPVDEAHCCDTSRSLRLMIGQHSKAISSQQECNPALVKQLLYRSDVSIQHPTELASLACTLWYLRNTYWVLNTHSYKMWIAWQSMMHTEVKEQGTDQTSLYYIGTSSNGNFLDLGDLVDNCN